MAGILPWRVAGVRPLLRLWDIHRAKGGESREPASLSAHWRIIHTTGTRA